MLSRRPDGLIMQPSGLPLNSLDIEPAIDRHPLTVAPDTPMVEILAMMSRLQSSCVLPNLNLGTATEPDLLPREQVVDHSNTANSCVVVVEGSKVLGVFTERDIVRLAAAGTSLFNLTIKDVLTQPAITLKYSEIQDIFTTLSIFRQHRIRHLPIVDDSGELLGVITHDSIRQDLQPINLLSRWREVADVMTPEVVHAPLIATVLDLAQLMAQQRVSCVVITEARSDRSNSLPETSPIILCPVGIVTERDILQFQALELDLSKMLARDVMSTPLFCLQATDSLWTAHQEMQQRRVRRLVVTGNRGELLGIVSQTSLLRVLNPADMYGVIEVLQQAVDERTSALKSTNELLHCEIIERQKAEKALQQAHDDLKRQVEERTAELAKTNELLKQDILERQAVEAALRQSEAQLRNQASQLEKTLHKLQKTQSQLIQTEKMSSLGQLVAGIAHEINNPINFIYGNVNYASQYIEDLLNLLQLYNHNYPQAAPEIQQQIKDIDLDFLKTDLPKLLGSMKAGADRIRDLVLSLRNFSRLDEAEMKFVDIHEGLDSTLLILQNKLKAKVGYPAIETIKEYGKLPLVECLGGQLNQVFMNIIANAIDALHSIYEEKEKPPSLSKSGNQKNGSSDQVSIPKYSFSTPTIWIRTQVIEKNQVQIQITDNGPGMTESVRSRLFDPFFTTKPVGQGTGLGLSISYQIIVEKHGGQLYCSSAFGEGAEFVIRIPIQQQHQPVKLRLV